MPSLSLEFSVAVLACLMGAGVTILMAGVPWAYSVHGRLTKIETTLRDHLETLRRVADLERRVTRLEWQQQAPPLDE